MARKRKTEETLTPEAETIRQDLSESPPCVRCNHGAEDHLGGECDQEGCECADFVYPSDPEGNGRLLDNDPKLSELDRLLYPLMRAYDEAKNVRCAATKVETAARNALGAGMQAQGRKKATIGGLEAEILSKGEKITIHATGAGSQLPLDEDEDEE